MKKKSQDSQKNLFLGGCDQCGELYEASSSVQDLEGLTFSCKKSVCSGRVELKLAASSASKDPALGDVSLSGNHQTTAGPRRYC